MCIVDVLSEGGAGHEFPITTLVGTRSLDLDAASFLRLALSSGARIPMHS